MQPPCRTKEMLIWGLLSQVWVFCYDISLKLNDIELTDDKEK